MSFSSYSFVFLFLPLTVTGYWLFVRLEKPAAARAWLLVSSIVFYACASLTSLLIVLPSILLDFGIAKLFFSLPSTKVTARAGLIAFGIAVNVLFLAFFKFGHFVFDRIGTLIGTNPSLDAWALPLGISFLTFQKIAFLSDVLAGTIVEVDLLEFLSFTLFFPRTIAGPIVHYKEIVTPLKNVRLANSVSDVTVGFCLFTIGLFKKCVLADGIAPFVAYAFDQSASAGPVAFVESWTGALAYVLQLYFDFSGYSDMALGAARMVGVRLPMNFNSPLKASSIVDYWSRWHITLTRFLTWYIYIPLVRRLTRARAARRKPLLRGQTSSAGAVVNLIGIPTVITMLVSGVWHGVGWQFVTWGLMHGLYLVINQTWRLVRPRFWKNQKNYELIMTPVGVLLTFTSVLIALVFFRASSVEGALSIIAGMAGLHGVAPHEVQLLRQVGFPFDWTVIWAPWDALKWIFLLLGIVALSPNSLELLRRFQPALDFPPDIPRSPSATSAIAATAPVAPNFRTSGLFLRFRRGLVPLRAPLQEGLRLNRVAATLIATLFALGTMAMGHASRFLYGAF